MRTRGRPASQCSAESGTSLCNKEWKNNEKESCTTSVLLHCTVLKHQCIISPLQDRWYSNVEEENGKELLCSYVALLFFSFSSCLIMFLFCSLYKYTFCTLKLHLETFSFTVRYLHFSSLGSEHLLISFTKFWFNTFSNVLLFLGCSSQLFVF